MQKQQKLADREMGFEEGVREKMHTETAEQQEEKVSKRTIRDMAHSLTGLSVTPVSIPQWSRLNWQAYVVTT